MALIAIQGCIHGDLRRSYTAIRQQKPSIEDCKIECLIWSGDVQTVRTKSDLDSLACPPKYREMKDFHRFYEGIETAECLTLFVGGNHEASAFIDKLYFGGWVAPNIYYLGKSSVVNLLGVRIAGISGIYNWSNQRKGYFETAPYDQSTIRSTYHVRQYEVNKLLLVEEKVDMVLSHDWPSEIITNDEDRDRLIRIKPYFEEELRKGELGNPLTNAILEKFKPKIWVAAHLHVNFTCKHTHLANTLLSSEPPAVTTFVAHDKPKVRVSTSYYDTSTGKLSFLKLPELVPPPPPEEEEDTRKRRKVDETASRVSSLQVDLEWLCVLKETIREFPRGHSAISELQLGASGRRATWLNAITLAANVDRILGTDWVEKLQPMFDARASGLGGESMVIPKGVDLSSFCVDIPDWNALNYRDPESQTCWWLDLLGEERDVLLVAPTVPPYLRVVQEQIIYDGDDNPESESIVL